MTLDLGELHHLVHAISNGDESSRRDAINSLKQRQEADWAGLSNKAVHSLVVALQHQIRRGTKQPATRQDAVVVLGRIGARSESAVPLLTELLSQGTPDAIREAAATALGRIGKGAHGAIDELCALLTNHRPALVIHAVRALGDIGSADRRVRAALLELWQPTSPAQKVQIQLALALCKLKIDAQGLVRYLTTTLMSAQDATLRKAAAEALAWCGKNEPDVVPALLAAAVRDKDEGVCQGADAALQQLRLSRDKAIELCAKQLKESPYAEAALRNSGERAVPALMEALQAPEPMTREKAARILGSYAERAASAVPALTARLRDKVLEVRLAAAKGLWNVTKNADAVLPVFVDLLQEKWAGSFEAGEERRRFLQAVMESLGRIGPPAKAAVAALTHKAKDKNRLISESALSAIKDISCAPANNAGPG
jgi:HEAT repeat protein